MIFKPTCDMLLDQNAYIGSDPIGHQCMNEAKYNDASCFICEECLNILHSDDYKRLTIPAEGSVKGWTERTEAKIREIMA